MEAVKNAISGVMGLLPGSRKKMKSKVHVQPKDQWGRDLRRRSRMNSAVISESRTTNAYFQLQSRKRGLREDVKQPQNNILFNGVLPFSQSGAQITQGRIPIGFGGIDERQVKRLQNATIV